MSDAVVIPFPPGGRDGLAVAAACDLCEHVFVGQTGLICGEYLERVESSVAIECEMYTPTFPVGGDDDVA